MEAHWWVCNPRLIDTDSDGNEILIQKSKVVWLKEEVAAGPWFEGVGKYLDVPSLLTNKSMFLHRQYRIHCQSVASQPAGTANAVFSNAPWMPVNTQYKLHCRISTNMK